MDFVNVTTQKQLDKVIAEGNVPVVRSGHFEISGSASVSASGSASVRASGSASVSAFGSASVSAFGSASVRASGSASVSASRFVAVHKHGDKPQITGGVLIEVPKCETIEEFCDYYGITAKRGKATVFKLVGDDYKSRNGAIYKPGEEVKCDDWNTRPECGGGLHFSPLAFMAQRYSDGTRYLACKVALKDVVVIPGGLTPDKVKAPACKVLFECTEDGEPLKP